MIYDASGRPLRRAIGFERALTKLSSEATDAVGSQTVFIEESDLECGANPVRRKTDKTEE
jgi:hypothetical protein